MQFVTTTTSVLIRALLVLAVVLGCYLFLATEAYAAFPSQLVPCGNDLEVRKVGCPDSPLGCYEYSHECNVCDLSKMGMNILNFLIAICVAVAALLFANAGFLYVTSSANPGNISRAHKMFTSTLIGLIAILAAYLLIDTVMKSLLAGGAGEVSGQGPWNEILCEGDTDSYLVPIIAPIELEASTIQLPKTQYCQSGTGLCMPSEACTGTPQADTTCDAGNICCVFDTGGGGTVPPPPPGDGDECATAGTGNVCSSGPCSVAELTPYFGDYARTMSQLCAHESSCNAASQSKTDVCLDGNSFSIGLFQINLTVHDIGGLDCTSVFTSGGASCRVKEEKMDLYKQCVAAAMNADTNRAYAATLLNRRSSGSKLNDWACSATKLGLCQCISIKCCWTTKGKKYCLPGC